MGMGASTQTTSLNVPGHLRGSLGEFRGGQLRGLEGLTRTSGRIGKVFEKVFAELDDIPSIARITDLLEGGRSPETRSQLSGIRRDITRTRSEGFRGQFADLLDQAEAGGNALSVGSGGLTGSFQRGPTNDALRVGGNALATIQSQTPTEFDIGGVIGERLGGNRNANLTALGSLASTKAGVEAAMANAGSAGIAGIHNESERVTKTSQPLFKQLLDAGVSIGVLGKLGMFDKLGDLDIMKMFGLGGSGATPGTGSGRPF